MANGAQWSDREDQQLVQLGQQYVKWRDISEQFMPDRSPSSLRCRFSLVATEAQKQKRIQLTGAKGEINCDVRKAARDIEPMPMRFEDDPHAVRSRGSYRAPIMIGGVASPLGELQ